MRVLVIDSIFPKITFSADGQSLLSDGRIIDVGQTRFVSEDRWRETSKNIVLKGEWIRCGSQNVLWLPHEYRGVSAIYDNLLAIGRRSGLVAFFEIDYRQESASD